MIRIACFDISQMDDDCYHALYSRSSPQRQERARACLHQEDKHRCIVADALTRYAARQALGRNDVSVATDEYGKPYFPDAPQLHFNLSHSGRWVVIAYGSSPVGIDVQQLRPDTAIEKLSRRHFTVDEQKYLLESSQQEQIRRFYQIWTGKESYLKYLGTGIRRPLSSFCIIGPTDSQLTYRWLEDHCLCLCCKEDEIELSILPAKDLLA